MIPNPKLILFIVMDTARSKAIDYDGFDKTPQISKFIKNRGALPWKYAISPSPWTIPTHVSFFTGVMPSEHGCIDYGFKINTSKDFLPEIARQKGYRTVGIVSNGLLTPSSGFNYGFEEYFSTWNIFQNTPSFYRSKSLIRNEGLKGILSVVSHILRNQPLKNIINILYRSIFSVKKDSTPSSIRTRKMAIKEIIKAKEQNKDLFLFLNFMQPHMDYNPPEKNKKKFIKVDYKETHQDPIKYYSNQYSQEKIKYFSELYQAEINYLDEEVGKIIEVVENQELMEDSLIILVSDHGEHIGEHNHISHYFTLYNELIHVPMITKFPDAWKIKLAVDNKKQIVQTHDLFQTVCEMINHKDVPNPENSLFSGPRTLATSELFMPSEYKYFLKKCEEYNSSFDSGNFIMNGMQNQQSFISNDLKFILREKGNHELYDFKNDIDEKQNLIDVDDSIYNDFVSSALQKSSLFDTLPKKRNESAKLVSRLRALGYF